MKKSDTFQFIYFYIWHQLHPTILHLTTHCVVVYVFSCTSVFVRDCLSMTHGLHAHVQPTKNITYLSAIFSLVVCFRFEKYKKFAFDFCAQSRHTPFTYINRCKKFHFDKSLELLRIFMFLCTNNIFSH